MAHLRPCDACLRHVRADAGRCPFCDHALAIVDDVARPRVRVGRAAGMALGAVVASAAIAAACGGNKPAETGGTSGAAEAGAPAEDVASPTTSATMDPNIAKPYGAPPADGLLV
jgi:hypothetical protein